MAELGPDRQHDVCRLQRAGRRPSIGQHAMPERIALVERAAAGDRGDHGRAQPPRHRDQLALGARGDDAAARDDQRARGRAQAQGGRLDVGDVAGWPSRRRRRRR